MKAEKEPFEENDLILLLIHSLVIARSSYPVLKIIAKTKTPYLIIAPTEFSGLNRPHDEYIHKYLKVPSSPSKYLWDIVLDAVSAAG